MKNKALTSIVMVGLCLIANQSFGAFYWTGGSPPSGTEMTINADVYFYVIDDTTGNIISVPDSTGDEIRGILKVRNISGSSSGDYWNSAYSTGELTGAFWGYTVTDLNSNVYLDGGEIKLFYDETPDFTSTFTETTPEGDEPSGAGDPWTLVGHGNGFSNGSPWLEVEGAPPAGGSNPSNTIGGVYLGPPLSMFVGAGWAAISTGGAGETIWDEDGADTTGLIAGLQDFRLTFSATAGAPGDWSFLGEGANGLSLEGLFVPEPSTMTGLFTLGLALVGLAWRRRRGC